VELKGQLILIVENQKKDVFPWASKRDLIEISISSGSKKDLKEDRKPIEFESPPDYSFHLDASTGKKETKTESSEKTATLSSVNHLKQAFQYQIQKKSSLAKNLISTLIPGISKDPAKKITIPHINTHLSDLDLLYAGNEEALEEVKKRSVAFITRREDLLMNKLKTHNIVQLVGESGVGKSRLLQSLKQKQKPKHLEVYQELSETSTWIKDRESNKTKILFIDEANIEDKNLTLFSPLKQLNGSEIIYDGVCLAPDIHHKLVTAKNPEEYGGGRNKQKLFSHNDCLEIHLNDFPVSYLYSEILLPIYQQAVLSMGIDPTQISESIFAQDCAHYLMKYIKQNTAAKNLNPNTQAMGLTARELQEYALRYCAKQAERKKLNKHRHVYKNTHAFVPTESNAAARVALDNFINIRLMQRNSILQADGIGLNGVLIEGSPGTGKSAVIRYMLERKGYQIKNPTEESKSELNELLCYKIDASLSLESKKNILLRAFKEGNAVWIDEINGCIDDGLEKLLNALLTGVDLEGNPANEKGFMMFATANSMGMEGRSLISPAIKHRCLNVKLGMDSEKDIARILQSNFPTTPMDFSLMAHDYVLLRNQDKNVNLRTYLKTIEPNIAFFKQQYPSSILQYQTEQSMLTENTKQKKHKMILALKDTQKTHAIMEDKKKKQAQEAKTLPHPDKPK